MRAFRRRPVLRLAPAAVAFALAGAGSLAATAPAGEGATPRVLSLDVRGVVTGGTAEYMLAGLQKAHAEGFDAVAISLDTPGGQLDATREIVQAMLESPVPTIVWVGPAGARAGSAGVFLTLAADVAAMHPTSNIGAAHPVTGTGKDVAEEAGKDMAKKVENDTAAFARSVAKANGRNAEWAEKAVRESVAVTADEAVKFRVVDLEAGDLRAAIEAAHGRTVATGGKEPKAVVRTKGATLEAYEKTVRQRLLSFLADPNVVALLMLLGTLGIAIEFYNPGMIVPGVVGAFALFLAFVAMRVIPVNAGAVILILAGVALLVAEAYVQTHGIAGLGGAACVVIGTMFFIDKSSADYQFDPGSLAMSPWIVWPTPAALALVLGFMGWKVARGRRMPLQLGAPALLGAEGQVLADVSPEGGEVFVHGEYWQARSAAAIPKGARVRVAGIEGLTVVVVSAEENR